MGNEKIAVETEEMMEILVLAGNPHKNGTSNTLVKEFVRGAEEAGQKGDRT